MRLPSEPDASSRVSEPSGPTRWSWPTTSPRAAGLQPVRERARRVAVQSGGGEEVATSQPPKIEEICCPSRLMVTRQTERGCAHELGRASWRR